MNLNRFATQSTVPQIQSENTFASRLAGGLDFPLTSNIKFNAELAWRRNRGEGSQLGRTHAFDASALMGLIGLRYGF